MGSVDRRFSKPGSFTVSSVGLPIGLLSGRMLRGVDTVEAALENVDREMRDCEAAILTARQDSLTAILELSQRPDNIHKPTADLANLPETAYTTNKLYLLQESLGRLKKARAGLEEYLQFISSYYVYTEREREPASDPSGKIEESDFVKQITAYFRGLRHKPESKGETKP